MVLAMLSEGTTVSESLAGHPGLAPEDVRGALQRAVDPVRNWRLQDRNPKLGSVKGNVGTFVPFVLESYGKSPLAYEISEKRK